MRGDRERKPRGLMISQSHVKYDTTNISANKTWTLLQLFHRAKDLEPCQEQDEGGLSPRLKYKESNS